MSAYEQHACHVLAPVSVTAGEGDEQDLPDWCSLSKANLVSFSMFPLAAAWSKLSGWGSEHSM